MNISKWIISILLLNLPHSAYAEDTVVSLKVAFQINKGILLPQRNCIVVSLGKKTIDIEIPLNEEIRAQNRYLTGGWSKEIKTQNENILFEINVSKQLTNGSLENYEDFGLDIVSSISINGKLQKDFKIEIESNTEISFPSISIDKTIYSDSNCNTSYFMIQSN